MGSSFFGSYRSRSRWTFFTLFPFVGVRLFSWLLICRLCCSARAVRPLLVLITVVAGNKITCYYDGSKKIEATDETFKDAGKVGLWTKADSVTYFDDLKVTTK